MRYLITLPLDTPIAVGLQVSTFRLDFVQAPIADQLDEFVFIESDFAKPDTLPVGLATIGQ